MFNRELRDFFFPSLFPCPYNKRTGPHLFTHDTYRLLFVFSVVRPPLSSFSPPYAAVKGSLWPESGRVLPRSSTFFVLFIHATIKRPHYTIHSDSITYVYIPINELVLLLPWDNKQWGKRLTVQVHTQRNAFSIAIPFNKASEEPIVDRV